MYYIKADIVLDDINRKPYKGLYRPHIVFSNNVKTSGLLVLEENEILKAGESYQDRLIGFYFQDIIKKNLKIDTVFDMYEGSIKIGSGKIRHLL